MTATRAIRTTIARGRVKTHCTCRRCLVLQLLFPTCMRSPWANLSALHKIKDDPSPGYRRPQHYDSSLPYDDEQARRPHSRSRSPRRQHGPGRPSATIIVEGLPGDVTEDDILDGFASVSPDLKVFNVDNVKAVRLRGNKRGSRIGFVEFYTVNDAAHFLEYHYPGLEFQLAHSRGVDSELVGVGINYSRGREDEGGAERGREDRGREEQDWKCPEVSIDQDTDCKNEAC